MALAAKMLSNDLAECIQLCQECQSACLVSFTQHCLKQGGAHVERQHAILMLDCADICQTAADFMRRSSGRHAEICDVCAEICVSCADSCAELDGMADCERACRACAASCQKMAA